MSPPPPANRREGLRRHGRHPRPPGRHPRRPGPSGAPPVPRRRVAREGRREEAQAGPLTAAEAAARPDRPTDRPGRITAESYPPPPNGPTVKPIHPPVHNTGVRAESRRPSSSSSVGSCLTGVSGPSDVFGSFASLCCGGLVRSLTLTDCGLESAERPSLQLSHLHFHCASIHRGRCVCIIQQLPSGGGCPAHRRRGRPGSVLPVALTLAFPSVTPLHLSE